MGMGVRMMGWWLESIIEAHLRSKAFPLIIPQQSNTITFSYSPVKRLTTHIPEHSS